MAKKACWCNFMLFFRLKRILTHIYSSMEDHELYQEDFKCQLYPFKLICLILDHGLFSRRFEMSGFNLLELEYIQVDLIKNWSEIVNQLISLF